ncbi:MAG: recombination regulator RecX [Gemmatimonadota bacterium]|nr:recombination regulator RecX [Gemmatimonadota bacterium]
MNLLSARPYTVWQLRRKLVAKEVPAIDADAAIGRLVAAGLMDDSRYALAYARSRLAGQGTSARRVAQDLARKGVAPEISRRAIEEVIQDEDIDPRAVIERVARKKVASMGDLDSVVLRRRLFAFLARRGYELNDIREAVASVGVSHEEDEP